MLALHRHLFLVSNAAYISGVIFIGTQALLFASMIIATEFAILMFVVYLLSVLVSYRFVTAGSIQRLLFLPRKGRYENAFLIGGITGVLSAFVLVPFSIIMNIAITGAISSPRYYAYAVILAFQVFGTTGFHFFRMLCPKSPNKAVLEKLDSLQMELIKTIIWGIGLAVIGTVYAQVLTSFSISAPEVILIFYSTVGVIGFLFNPFVQWYFETADALANGMTV